MKKPLAITGGPARLALAALFWSAIGLLFVLPRLATVTGTERPAILLSSLAQWWAWGLLAPLIVGSAVRLDRSAQSWSRRWLTQLPLALLFTAAYIYLYALVQAVLGVVPWSRLVDGSLPGAAMQGSFAWSLLVYGLIVGVWHIQLSHRRSLVAALRMERLERGATEARLQALRLQLDPHFLFNALNTISTQVTRDPKLARNMIEHLGDLLRLSLDTAQRHEVTLAQELAFLDHYLAIQQIRFGAALTVELNIAPALRLAIVPTLLLQPLVENAIRHGIGPKADGGRLTVSARVVDGRLQLRVLDDGVGLPIGWPAAQHGLGLTLTRQRLAALHPGAASQFALLRRDGGGTEVRITLPLRLQGVPHAQAA